MLRLALAPPFVRPFASREGALTNSCGEAAAECLIQRTVCSCKLKSGISVARFVFLSVLALHSAASVGGSSTCIFCLITVEYGHQWQRYGLMSQYQ